MQLSPGTRRRQRQPRQRMTMPIRGAQLKSSMTILAPKFSPVYPGDQADRRSGKSITARLGMKVKRAMLLLLVTAVLTTLPIESRSQSLSSSEGLTETAGVTTSSELDQTYVRPTQKTMVINYTFDAFGPYPIVGASFAAGINQLSNAPPEWNQGAEGFGKRFGSDFGIAAVGTTARYGLAEAFKEDTLYYRCECRGTFLRLRHAAISTLTARRGEGGHRAFSLSALVAPYAGSMAAVYGWYPNRFGAKDAFRMGNYSLMGYVGGNIALEFLYSGPHSMLTRMHLNNGHGAPDPGPNH